MKRYAILLAALLLLALCAGCGRQAAEPETLADYMAALTADDVTDWNTEQYPDITLGRLVAAMNRAAAHQIPQAEAARANMARSAFTLLKLMVFSRSKMAFQLSSEYTDRHPSCPTITWKVPPSSSRSLAGMNRRPLASMLWVY